MVYQWNDPDDVTNGPATAHWTNPDEVRPVNDRSLGEEIEGSYKARKDAEAFGAMARRWVDPGTVLAAPEDRTLGQDLDYLGSAEFWDPIGTGVADVLIAARNAWDNSSTELVKTVGLGDVPMARAAERDGKTAQERIDQRRELYATELGRTAEEVIKYAAPAVVAGGGAGASVSSAAKPVIETAVGMATDFAIGAFASDPREDTLFTMLHDMVGEDEGSANRAVGEAFWETLLVGEDEQGFWARMKKGGAEGLTGPMVFGPVLGLTHAIRWLRSIGPEETAALRVMGEKELDAVERITTEVPEALTGPRGDALADELAARAKRGRTAVVLADTMAMAEALGEAGKRVVTQERD